MSRSNSALARLARPGRRAVGALVAALSAVGMVAILTASGGGIAAAAGAPPPFEPDPSSIGGLVFFNAAGQAITGGSITDGPFAAYVQASGGGRAGDTKATLFGYLPKNGVATGSWAGEALTASTSYPNAGAPAAVNVSTAPVVSLTAADETLATLAGNFPNTASDAYQGLYQLRLKTSGPGQTAGATYYSADVLITGTTWTVVFSSLPSVYSPFVPARLLETRPNLTTIDGDFNRLGLRAARSITELQVAGRGNVPGGASAVVLNVTATEPEVAGFLTVFPCGSPVPTASNVNYVAGQTVPNAVVVKLGTGGKVCIFTSQATQLVVDVDGFYPAASPYVALVPGRLLETRPNLTTIDGQSNNVGFLAARSITEVPVINRANVAATASAVVLNVTATESTAGGFLTVFPCGSPLPTTSNVNFDAGQTIAGAVIARIGTGGKVCVFNSQATHLVVDVSGYYPNGSAYAPLVPARLLETRPNLTTIDGQSNNGGFVAARSITQLPVAGRGGVLGTASAVVLNVTSTESNAAGFLTVFPCGSPLPTTSSLNFSTGETIANAVVSQVGTGGAVCIFNSQATHLVVDVNGYYP